MTGGGSGGHITPILAVASELKRLQPGIRVVYIGQKGDELADIPAQDASIDAAYAVRAGKFRRYHGEGWKQLLDISTQVKNVRDGFRVLMGIWQSYWLLRKLQPAIIFTRGGFVSVPVALGGWLNRIPYITHDSDSVPSLANRLIARWAVVHAVALPADLYPYPRQKTVTVGIPLSGKYVPVTPNLQAQYRKELGLDSYQQLLLVTGGGNGAERLNQAVIANAPYLLERYPRLAIVHVAGRTPEPAVSAAYDRVLSTASIRKRAIVKGFITDMYRYSGAADVIITRAGATTIAEFAVQAKACIIVPAAQLTGGHQIKNAQALAEHQAIVMLAEAQSEQERRLAYAVAELLDDAGARRELGVRLAKFASVDAAKRLAMLLLEESNTNSTSKTHEIQTN